MRVTLTGENPDITVVADGVGERVGKILKAEGYSANRGNSYVERAGTFGAQVVLLAFERMGVLQEPLDQTAFVAALDEIEAEAGIDEIIRSRERGRD